MDVAHGHRRFLGAVPGGNGQHAGGRKQQDIPKAEGHEKMENVECQPWFRDRMSIIALPWRHLAGKEVSVSDLSSEAIVIRESGSGNRQAMER
jgi:hypothetical protein